MKIGTYIICTEHIIIYFRNARDTVYGLPEDSNEIDWLKISTIDVRINSLNFAMRKHFSISYHFSDERTKNSRKL